MKRLWESNQKQSGFTIVELLIVIVVIGILAAITTVAYNGIQGQANDTAVKADIGAFAKKLEIYRVANQYYPVGTDELASIGLSVTKGSYGQGFSNGAHNLLYCRIGQIGFTPAKPDRYAIVASSKSGQVFSYRSDSGIITEASSWAGSSSTDICRSLDIDQRHSHDRDVLYLNRAWLDFLN